MYMASRAQTARRLRRHQTDAERILWFRLRDRRLNGWKFRRQKPLNGFVVDFCCPDAKLIVELDGGQHSAQKAKDARRIRSQDASGDLVLRFWNNEVLGNVEGVLEEILNTISQQQTLEPPHPTPLPFGEREPA
jgi:very-short-patch-repair endonuclease